jgi:8-oxo-dGTP diphosphatase
MVNPVQEFFGNRLRVRACGLCVINDQLLLINHRSLANGPFWVPPGGGIEFGESTAECLIREFHEETGLVVEPMEFLFTAEFIAPPLHAIELFFRVEKTGGELKTGADPEMKDQIIEEVKFVGWPELRTWDTARLHGAFQKVSDPSRIMELRGYLKL